MNAKQHWTEKRKEARFKVKTGAFAVPKPRSALMGQIINISRGGLTFGYVENQGRAKKSFEVTIAMLRKGFKLEKIPCRMVTDLEVTDISPPKPLKIRQCCVQFGEMSQDQSVQLEYFIQNHTHGLI